MAGHFFKKWPHRVVLGGGPWGSRPSGGAGFGGGSCQGGSPGVHFWGSPRRGPFFGVPGGEGSGDPSFGLLGCFGLFLRFWAVLGYFLGVLSKNAVFDVLGLKCSKMSVFFIENNFWNNISARDASPWFL